MPAKRSGTKSRSPRDQSSKERAGYHHGDLRRVLLDAATDAIESEGLDALSLRGIAARAGVSHAAPYRHFADKDALIAALAEAGFDELREDVARAAARGRDGVGRLVEAAVAYVDFAARRGGRYEVMFRHRRTGVAAHVAASDRAFYGLAALIESAQAAGELPAVGRDDMARAAWALVHGLSELVRTDRLGVDDAGDLGRLTRLAARALIEGFGGR